MKASVDSVQNTAWHLKNRLPANPTLDQRVIWHLEHARNCPCPPPDSAILDDVKKRYMHTHQEFWIFFNRNDHRALARWAAGCADHVLPCFENKHPDDHRPRHAIDTLSDWIETGHFTMSLVRHASLAAHAAARDAGEDTAARWAARAAGQAVATAHVPTHALGPALYALKAVAATNPTDVRAAIAAERIWQRQRLPDNLRTWVETALQQKQQLLPKNLRAGLV